MIIINVFSDYKIDDSNRQYTLYIQSERVTVDHIENKIEIQRTSDNETYEVIKAKKIKQSIQNGFIILDCFDADFVF